MQDEKNRSNVLFEVRKMTQFEIMKVFSRMIQKTEQIKLMSSSSMMMENVSSIEKKMVH